MAECWTEYYTIVKLDQLKKYDRDTKNPHFTAALAAWLENEGLNGKQFAAKLGISVPSAYTYIAGRMPEWWVVVRLAEAMNTSVDWLLTGEGEMRKPGMQPVEAGGGEYLSAAEETVAYGKDRSKRGPDLASLSPDELIYVGKLLKILRSPNKSTTAAIKHTVDAFFKTAEQSGEEASAPKDEKEPQ